MPAQRTAALKAITMKPYSRRSPLSGHEATPSLGSGSDDNDRSSDFEIETRTKKIKSGTRHEESDDEYDIKPDLSDDEWDGHGDVKQKIKTPSKGKGGNKSKAPGSSSKNSNTSSGGGASPKRLGQAWTGEEDWALFQYLHPKIKPDWKTAAAAVGRDAKACQNRYAVFGKKLEAIIKNASGK